MCVCACLCVRVMDITVLLSSCCLIKDGQMWKRQVPPRETGDRSVRRERGDRIDGVKG